MPGDMSAEEARVLVGAQLGEALRAGERLRVERADGTPAAWYVTLEDRDGPLLGGSAWVVLAGDRTVHAVPAGRPPFLNLREVRDRGAAGA